MENRFFEENGVQVDLRQVAKQLTQLEEKELIALGHHLTQYYINNHVRLGMKQTTFIENVIDLGLRNYIDWKLLRFHPSNGFEI